MTANPVVTIIARTLWEADRSRPILPYNDVAQAVFDALNAGGYAVLSIDTLHGYLQASSD